MQHKKGMCQADHMQLPSCDSGWGHSLSLSLSLQVTTVDEENGV